MRYRFATRSIHVRLFLFGAVGIASTHISFSLFCIIFCMRYLVCFFLLLVMNMNIWIFKRDGILEDSVKLKKDI